MYFIWEPATHGDQAGDSAEMWGSGCPVVCVQKDLPAQGPGMELGDESDS